MCLLFSKNNIAKNLLVIDYISFLFALLYSSLFIIILVVFELIIYIFYLDI